MSLQTAFGTLTQPGATGNQSVTGLGFQPAVVLFWADGQTANGAAAGAVWSFGVGISSTSRRAVAFNNVDNSASAVINRSHDDSKCLVIMDGAATYASAADFVSLDSGGFTINWTTADATARLIRYLALGGADLTNVALGTISEPIVTGNQATTGLGFQPDTLILFESRSTVTAPPSFGAGSAACKFGVAAFNGSTIDQWAQAWRSLNTASPSDEQHIAKAGVILSHPTIIGGNTTIEGEASLSSFDAGGFTLNYTTAPGVAYLLFYLALKGASARAGTFTKITTTGLQSVTGPGLQPQALLLSSFNDVAQTTASAAGSSFSWGLTTGTASRSASYAGGANAVTPTNTSRDADNTKVLKLETPGHATPTVNSAADLSSFDGSGFTLNWTTADVTAEFIGYLTFGAAPSTGWLVQHPDPVRIPRALQTSVFQDFTATLPAPPVVPLVSGWLPIAPAYLWPPHRAALLPALAQDLTTTLPPPPLVTSWLPTSPAYLWPPGRIAWQASLFQDLTTTLPPPPLLTSWAPIEEAVGTPRDSILPSGMTN